MFKIALIGKQRAGKDTIADFLVANYGFMKYPLAEGVYEIAQNYFGMTEKDRGLLIKIGEYMRKIDPLVWCKHTLSKIEKSPFNDGSLINFIIGVIIPDVRMEHEMKFLKEQGFILIHVKSDETQRAKRPGYTPEFESDPTEPSDELATKYADATIENNGTIDELYHEIEKVMKML